MATFIAMNTMYEESTGEDAAVQGASYLKDIIHDVKGAEQAAKFESKFSTFWENDEFNKIFEFFLIESAVIFEHIGEDKNKENDADGFFAVLLSLLMRIDSETEVERLSMKLCLNITEGTTAPELRLRTLMMLHNLFQPMYCLRYPVFKHILQYSSKTSQTSRFIPYCELLDNWLMDWSLDDSELKWLFFNLAQMLRTDEPVNFSTPVSAYGYLNKYLQLFQDASEKELLAEDPQQAAYQMILDTVQHPTHLRVDDLMALDAVRAMQKTDKAPLVDLLQVFLTGGLEDYQVLQKKNPGMFSKHSIDADTCLCKMRLIALASLCQDRSEIPLSEIGQALQVQDVEQWVVRALSQGVVNGRIDQVRQLLLAKSALQRTFSLAQWKQLDQSISSWTKNIESLLSTMKKAPAVA